MIQKKSFPEQGNVSLPPPAHPVEPHTPFPWAIFAQCSGSIPLSLKAIEEFGLIPTSNCDCTSRKKPTSRLFGTWLKSVHFGQFSKNHESVNQLEVVGGMSETPGSTEGERIKLSSGRRVCGYTLERIFATDEAPILSVPLYGMSLAKITLWIFSRSVIRS